MIFTINTLYTNYIYIKFHALITISTILFFSINHHPFFFLHPNASKRKFGDYSVHPSKHFTIMICPQFISKYKMVTFIT